MPTPKAAARVLGSKADPPLIAAHVRANRNHQSFTANSSMGDD